MCKIKIRYKRTEGDIIVGKYELLEDYVHFVEIEGTYSVYKADIENNKLTIYAGYIWNGPSGPAIDTENFMRGSLVHDCLYKFMRQGKLSSKFREYADKLLYTICRADGMCRFRATYVWLAVRLFAGRYARPK